jgi:hypothetical protein
MEKQNSKPIKVTSSKFHAIFEVPYEANAADVNA